MRSKDEILYVHELFSLALVNADLRRKIFGVYDGAIDCALAMQFVLCWALGCRNTIFMDVIATVEDKLAELGIEMPELKKGAVN